jgi:hypothetical protein
MNLKQTVRPKTSATCIGASMTLRTVTSLERIYLRMRRVIWLQASSQLLNVQGVNDVRQTEIHTAEPLVPEPSAFEVELDIGRLKSHRSQGTTQIPA